MKEERQFPVRTAEVKLEMTQEDLESQNQHLEKHKLCKLNRYRWGYNLDTHHSMKYVTVAPSVKRLLECSISGSITALTWTDEAEAMSSRDVSLSNKSESKKNC